MQTIKKKHTAQLTEEGKKLISTMKPKFTLISYHTSHGDIFALTQTDNPDTITYGFTGKEECIEQLRRTHQRRYMHNNNIENVPVLPGNTATHKRLEDWLDKFIKENNDAIPYEGKDIPLIKETSENEVDHCTIREWKELLWSPSHNAFFLHGYSTWYGIIPLKSTASDNPKDFDTVVEFIQKNKETIISNLYGNK